MNDETLDELLSTALDGNATDGELARIAQTPGAEDRLAELRIAADAVSAMLPRVPTDQRESMIAAAVASFEPKGVPGAVAPTAGPQELPPQNVVPLRSPLAQQMRSGAAMVGGIAASLVVMLFVFNLVGTNFGGSSSENESADAAVDTVAPAATTAPGEDAASLSADAESFDAGGSDDGAEESDSMAAAGSVGMADEAVAPTTEAMSGSTDFAQDAARSVPDQGLACWEQITQDFAQLNLDPDVDSVLENGLLQIPTLDESGELGWLVVEPNSCLFVETLPRQ